MLLQSVASVMAQDYPNFELIIVDDCSADNTPEVVAGLHDQHGDRVRGLRLPQTSGVSASRNAGLRAARGSLIAFLDDDDLWLPGKLAAQVRALEKQPECGLCYGKALRALADGSPTRQVYGGSARGRTGDSLYPMLRHHAIICSTLMVRASVFDKVAAFDETLTTGEDTDLFLRLAAAFPGVYLNRPLTLMRQHLNRKTRTEAGDGTQARCCLTLFGRLWGEETFKREPLRGLVAGKLAGAFLALNEVEEGRLLDHEGLLEAMHRRPEWFRTWNGLWHVADRLVRREPQEPGAVLRMARALAHSSDSTPHDRPRAAMFLNAAVRRAIRRGKPRHAPRWALHYALMMARLASDRVARYHRNKAG